KARPGEGEFADDDPRGVDGLPDDEIQGGTKGREPRADLKLDVSRLVIWDEPDRIADLLLELFLQGDVSTAAREALVEFISKDNPKDASLDQRIRAAAHAIMTMPEYQLA